MQIGSIGGASSLWDIAAINNDVDNSYSGISRQTTSSGDSVDISDEARKLYSQMIHKYDKSAQSSASGEAAQNAESGGQASGAGGGGGAGAGESESSSTVEKIKSQIQSLKSQIMALASQAAAAGPGSAPASQMNALEAQVAALEAQLNSMAEA